MRKIKKAAASLLCMAMLMVCAMSAVAANTSVAGVNGCSHSTLIEGNSGTPTYTSNGSGNHTKTYVCDLICASCGTVRSKSVTMSGTENHSFSYVDLGHTGTHSHKYQRHCAACGYNDVISIACSNFGGSHATP